MIALAAIAAVMLTSAIVAMALRNLIRSALCLVVTWLAVAFFYLWAGAEFVAFAQVLVYVGAISMVVLFAVLLTRTNPAPTTSDIAGEQPGKRGWRGLGPILTAVTVFGILALAIRTSGLSERKVAPAPRLSVKQIGEQLTGSDASALLVAGVLLTVALLGAVVLAANDRSGQKEDGS